jgi:DNA-binding transcriptional MerR regulator
MDELYLKTGEFAHLCATTKETLRHYRDIGLLCPVQVAPNGYQYYSVMQMADFLFISALQSAGYPLQEIRAYLTAPSKETLQEVLKDMLGAIQQEKRAIAQKECLFKHTLATFDLLATAPVAGECIIEECPEEYYIQTRVLASDMSEQESGEALREHLSYCMDNAFVDAFRGAYRVGHEAFMRGEYLQDTYLCNKVLRRIRSERLHVKPRGLYLKVLRTVDLVTFSELDGKVLEEASRNMMFEGCDALKHHAEKNGYRIIGDMYETELSIYTGNLQEPANNLLSVMVEKV